MAELRAAPAAQGAQRGEALPRAEWLARFVVPHERWLRGMLRRSGLAGEAIEDVVQEAYLRLLNAKSVAHVRDPRNYFSRSAISVVLTRHRRSQCVREESHASEFFATIPSAEPSMEVVLDARRQLATVDLALDRFSERTRDVVLLRRLDLLSGRQTAERLHISESAVEKHLSRGMRALERARATLK